MSCRTGLLLSGKSNKTAGDCDDCVPRPLDVALGLFTLIEIAREEREQGFFTLFIKQQKPSIFLSTASIKSRSAVAPWVGVYVGACIKYGVLDVSAYVRAEATD